MQENNIFLQAQTEKAYRVCKIAQIISQLSSEQLIQFSEALEAVDRISNKTLSETLKKRWNFSVGYDSIGKHRRKACTCYVR